ncbi:MAG: TetR/AcrR family transcriptional regulator [Rubellimicrobium sp.]|nr:TetR/AcrR family transcriptional regulator [Rubellimicrobium sp.]
MPHDGDTLGAGQIRPLPRADEILDRCRTAFAQKGFEGASMQDLARAAGMSASNFYRYFPSKDAIIVALVERELAEIEARFAALAQGGCQRDTLLGVLGDYLVARECEPAEAALWAEMQAAAGRRPAIAEALARMERTVTDHLLSVFHRMAARPGDHGGDEFRAHAAMIFLLSRGALLTWGTAPRDPDHDLSRRLLDLVLRAAGQVLDDVHSAR